MTAKAADRTTADKLLEQQGVRFDDEVADPGRRVTWDALHQRDKTEPAAK